MIIRSIVDFIIALLPTFSFPVEMLSAFSDVVNWVVIANHYIPVFTFLACVGIYFTVWVTCAVISAILQLL